MAIVRILANQQNNYYLLSVLVAVIGLLSPVSISWKTHNKLSEYVHQSSLPQFSLFIRSCWQSDVSICLLLPTNPCVLALFPHYLLTSNKPHQSSVVRGLKPHFSEVY